MVVLLLLCTGLFPSGWHRKQTAGFVWRKRRWKGVKSKLCFKHLYCWASWDLSKSWKVSSGLHSAEQADPIGAGTALWSWSIHFSHKMLLLQLNIYNTTTRPHHESWLVVIISWLSVHKIQTPLTPGNARWESWHAGAWVTVWCMSKWWNTESLWPQQTAPPPLRRTECITFTASGLGTISAWCSKTAESAARCSTSADSFMFVIMHGRINVILKLPALICWNSRHFDHIAKLFACFHWGKEDNEMTGCCRPCWLITAGSGMSHCFLDVSLWCDSAQCVFLQIVSMQLRLPDRTLNGMLSETSPPQHALPTPHHQNCTGDATLRATQA